MKLVFHLAFGRVSTKKKMYKKKEIEKRRDEEYFAKINLKCSIKCMNLAKCDISI